MVKLARVSRAGYYRFDENGKSGSDSDMDLRDAIQRVALEWPSYGRRRNCLRDNPMTQFSIQ
jgi:hypothetical protein